MIDFVKMLGHGLEFCRDKPVILATPYDVPERIARDLKRENRLHAIIADNVEHAKTDPEFGGWWVDRRNGRIFLRRNPGGTLLIAGVGGDEVVGANILLEAKLKGFDNLVTTDFAGNLIEDLNIAAAIDQRLDTPVTGTRVGVRQYTDAFDEMYELLGQALRLRPGDFVQDRVALVIGGLGPGGAERQASLTAIGLKAAGTYEPVMICNYLKAPGDFFLQQVIDAGVTVTEVNPLPEELKLPQVTTAIAILNERYSALRMGDVLHEVVRYAASLRQQRPATVHLWMDYCSVLGGVAANLVGIPAIVTGGRSVAPNRFNLFQPYMKDGYLALAKRKKITMLNNSHAGADDYCSFLGLPRDRIRVIQNGFEFSEPNEHARVEKRTELGIDPGAKVVGSILRFSEEKRPRLLIDMACNIHSRNPDVRFIFFGDGPLLQEERKYVESLQLADVIKLPGYTDPARDALAAMDMFALVSRMEGLPNVLIEAQAAGLPIVCTGVGGMNETFEPGVTGFAVKSATPEDLGERVLDILEDNARLASMSSAARLKAISHFGMARMINDTVDAYRQSARAG
jgi:glycosyltransferase involved in cell wall biosynthesis